MVFNSLSRNLKLVGGKILLLLITLCLVLKSSGQTIDRNDLLKYKTWPRYGSIVQFYELNNFLFVWWNDLGSQKDIIDLIQLSNAFGLNKTDYQYQFLDSYASEKFISTKVDSFDIEIKCTDAAIHFFTELKHGNRTPSFKYNGLTYDPVSKDNILTEILSHLKKRTLRTLLFEVQPETREYQSILSRLNKFQKIVSEDGFRDAEITSLTANLSNKPLLLRLYQLGITDSAIKSIEKKTLTAKIIEAKKLFDLLSDGVLTNTVLYVFNIPLRKRIEELKSALNYLRWIEQIRQTSVLLLNIPSAYLMVYENGKIILDSKVVVGKPATPTPTLTSTITEVILYPYWNVPNKIATREILPSIKRDIGFLNRGNYQVLNSQGKVVDPYKINWHSLSTSYFPYTIRQSTGCDNALGIVKFNFYNPFTVYLHDTPYKGLFSFNKRYFSHGCMRVDNYLELAHFLLGRNRKAIDTLTAKGCLYQQAPKPVPVERDLPIIILYSTVWYNKEGVIKFYDDVYRYLN